MSGHLAAGDSLIEGYWTHGEASNLEKAVTEYRSAVADAHATHDDKVHADIRLAEALRISLEEGLGSEEEHRQARSLTEEAIKQTTPTATLHLEALRVRGELLTLRGYSNKSTEEGLLAAETFRQLVVAGGSNVSSARQALYLALYATSLVICCYDRTGDAKYLAPANDFADRALARAREANVETRESRGFKFRNADDMDEASLLIRELVKKTPKPHPLLWRFFMLLGVTHGKKHMIFGTLDDLDQAVDAFEQARTIVPLNNPFWYVVHANYADALYFRFVARSDITDLDQAIDITRLAVDRAIASNRDDIFAFHHMISNLAGDLVVKYAQCSDLDLLDEAIDLQLNYLEQTGTMQRHSALITLANAYLARFTAHGRMQDLNSAISLHQEALECVGVSEWDLGYGSHDLADALLYRYDEIGAVEDIEKAISVLQAVLPKELDSELHGRNCSLLGIAYLRRAAKAQDRKNVQECIQCQTQALQLLAPEHSEQFLCHYRLGLAHYLIFMCEQQVTAILESIAAFNAAFAHMPLDHPNAAKYLLDLAISQLASEAVHGSQGVYDGMETLRRAASHERSWPGDRYAAASEWAHTAHEQGMFSEALEAYRLAISLLPQVTWIGLEDELRVHRLARQPADISQAAAACAIELGQLETAVELLEGGRALLWNTAQELRADLMKLAQVAPDLAQELGRTCTALAVRPAQGQSTSESEREYERHRLHNLASKRTQLIESIRALPGFERFLLPPSFEVLKRAAANGPVVVLNSSIYRCDALIICIDQPIRVIPFTDLTNAQVKKEAWALQVALSSVKDKSGLEFFENVLLRLLRRLWQWIGQPVLSELELESLGCGRRIWWCPTGAMSFLPIHACGLHDGQSLGMADLVVSSYTPTLSALVRSHMRNKRAKPSSSPVMLVVSQPAIPGRAPLPCATEELAIVERLFMDRATFLVGPRGTLSEVEAALPHHSWLHISSHGTQNATNPLDSVIALHDGGLTLSKVSQCNLPNAEFAFLSACHSAKGTDWIPDESMHLAAGMMFAGFRSVVATMWGIADQDAPHLARDFYLYLLRTGNPLSATDTAEALHFAICSLRRSGLGLYRWVPFIHLGA